MQIKLIRIKFLVPALMVAVIWSMLMMATRGYAGGDPEKAIVAAGDDFVMSQKTVDAYGAFFKSQQLNWSREEIVKTALKYELLSREYRNKQDFLATQDTPAGNADLVQRKILDGQKYILARLDTWEVPGVAIESYYRCNPEKYSMGKASDGTIILKPLDDREKNEIRFKIIEGKKETITKEIVDSLISKYHIAVHNGA
jgi:hypothetical protein